MRIPKHVIVNTIGTLNSHSVPQSAPSVWRQNECSLYLPGSPHRAWSPSASPDSAFCDADLLIACQTSPCDAPVILHTHQFLCSIVALILLAELAIGHAEGGGHADCAADYVAQGNGEKILEEEGLPRDGST